MQRNSYDYFKSLEDICDIIYQIAIKYGRIGGHIAIYRGCVKFYAQFRNLSLRSLIYPQYYHNPLPAWLQKVDHYVAILLKPLQPIFTYYQHRMYRLAYQKAIKKYPYLKTEITRYALYPQLLNKQR